MKANIAILGSGPAACALAIRASQADMRVVVVGRLDAKRYAKTPETVPGAATVHFEELGLDFKNSNFVAGTQYLMSSAWGTDDLRTRTSIVDVAGPGLFIHRAAFDAALLASAANSTGVVIIDGTIRALERRNSVWEISLFPSQTHLQADFVVDASGRNSSLARVLGIKRFIVDRQACVEVQVTTNSYKETMVESTADGWWFSAPLGKDSAVLSWFTSALTVHETLRSDKALSSRLALAEHTARGVEPLPFSSRVVRVAETSFLSRFAGEAWLAIGDAAISPDPLSSQGVFAALESSRIALHSIAACLLGTANGLQQYTEYQRLTARRLVRDRQKFYDMEERWKQHPFWQQRSSSAPSYAI